MSNQQTAREIKELELRLEELERMERHNMWLLLMLSFVLLVLSYAVFNRLWS